VFDEIFRGTNVDDALDITKTTVNGLVRRKGSFFLLSTHLLQLDAQLNSDCRERVRKCYIECNLEEGSPKFSYRLKEGWSQLKIGKILFEKEGLAQMLSEDKNGTIQQHLYSSSATA
jgi:DNA mismatch repair protein MutS